ncbi:MAG TPA: PAS domain S-box protein [Burkholderiaceae bacterium]|nr:PAS domain S-box protein [Burkholderiaceae bacterium]HQR69256.1 PAS domain S-box protein [Burkholderiaceae bacterium]
MTSTDRGLAFGMAPPAAAAQPSPDVRGSVTAAPGLEFFEECPDAILRFDAERRVVYANPAIERATAISRREFIDHALEEVERFAAFAPLWNQSLAAVLESHEARWFKFLYPHPTGSKLFDVRLQIETGVDPQHLHVTAVLRDVTVPKSALRATRAAAEFIEGLLASASLGIGVLDRDDTYRVWNDHLEELLGVPAHEVLGRTFGEAAGLSRLAGVEAELLRLSSGAARTPIEIEARSPEGEQPWVRVKLTPVFDAGGRYDGVFATVERIDRDHFAEGSLAALQRALERVGEMVLEVDRHGSIVDANETALSVLGYDRDGLRGAALGEIDTGLGADGFEALYEQLRARGSYRGPATYRNRFGSAFPVEVVVQRVEQGGREFILLLARDASERRRAELALTESAERFRALFDESPVATLLLDAGFRVIGANRSASDALGYPVDELIGQDPETFVIAADLAGYCRVREQLRSGVLQSDAADRRFTHRDGRTVWTRLHARAVAGGEGPRHYLLVLENFTDRKIFEEQLQVALRDQQTLFETMSVGVAQTMSGKILLANREFSDMFGYRDGQVIGMPLWDLTIDRDSRMPNEISGMPVVRANQTTSAEVVLFRKDGEPIWCLVQARPIQSESTGVESLREAIYTFQNISEMKRQREALSRSLLELNVVLDATATGVMHLQDDRVVRCNAQAQFMFGRPGAELVGTPIGALFASEADYFEAITPLRAQLATGSPASFEGLMKGRSGTFWGLVSLRKIDPKVPAQGMIASILDISDRKKQEEELQTALAQQQLIFDTALVGLLFVRDGRPVRANSAMDELLACEPGGLVKQIQLFTHPTDHLLLASLAEHYPRIRETGACEFELYMYRRKADPIWVAVQGRAVNPERPELGYIFAFVDIDERKRSERELRSTLAELQLIFDNALVAMLYVSNDLILKANAATERLFGYDPRDYSELVVSSLFAAPADWEQVSAEVMDTHADDRYSFELLMRRADGSTFWCAGNGRLLEPGAPERGLILSLMDVDARRRSEEELKRVRNYLDLVVENLPVLVSVREAETGRFVSLNRAGELITGLSRQQVIGRTWREVYARQFADLYAELDRKALATGSQVDRPRDVMLRADGKRLTVNQRVVPLFEPGPGVEALPRYVMSIIDDLTEEVRAEVALRETETRFRQFAENIDQLVFIMTGDFANVLYVNPRYQALIGAQPEELVENPRSALRLVIAEEMPGILRLLPRLVARMRRLLRTEFRVHINHYSRGVRLIDVRLNPVRMEDGAIRVFGVADDITEREAAERQRMEEIVKQRDILVREVHHRIKNNLQGVAGLIQQAAAARPEVAPALEEAAAQIQAIAQVHGLQIRSTGTLPVLGVAQGIFQNLGSMFGVEVRFDPPAPDLWRFGLPESEAVPLALVINELGTNAIKHRSSRSDVIQVRVTGRPEGMDFTIENPGQLKPGFSLPDIAASVSGLGLVKALLPRRGARLSIEAMGPVVVARLQLAPPAIREENV